MSKLVAKAVYPVLRTFSGWDKEEAELLEEVNLSDDEEVKQSYGEREFEYSEVEPGVIAKYSGVSRPRVFDALADLKKRFMIEPNSGHWKVYLNPPKYYKREFLNEQLMAAFRSEMVTQDED